MCDTLARTARDYTRLARLYGLDRRFYKTLRSVPCPQALLRSTRFLRSSTGPLVYYIVLYNIRLLVSLDTLRFIAEQTFHRTKSFYKKNCYKSGNTLSNHSSILYVVKKYLESSRISRMLQLRRSLFYACNFP